MPSPGVPNPLEFHRLDRATLSSVAAIELDPDHVERFLGPLEDIAAAVRDGPAHAMVAIHAGRSLIGFYVLHPDRRDAACWWLGWIALDRRHQGNGYGRTALAHVMAAFRRIPTCRRARLLVAPDNHAARRLYTEAGFRPLGIHRTGELILEATILPARTILPATRIRAAARPGHASRQGRLRLNAGPYAARMIGVERGPPN